MRVLAWIDDDWVHHIVVRFQADVVFFLVEAFQRHFIVDHGNHFFAVGSVLLLLDDDVIAVLDVAVDHRVAVDLQDEAVGAAEDGIDLQAFALFDSGNRRAGGDLAQEGQSLCGGADDRRVGWRVPSAPRG